MGPRKTPEHVRLEQARTGEVPWKAWGPYLSERQWGTVREDYSSDGDAWNHFTHDQARSRAYRWGEDGIAGICDERQRLCLALALWNGEDPILKERMFGLTNSEGNHGEDAKEYWFYLDSTPTHSYLKCQYKYPQRAFPYADLVDTNARRGKQDYEYELLDTGIFDDDRYFDVVVEYAKAGHDDLLMRVTAHNRGPADATLHLLPTLWFRNTWSWGREVPKPSLNAEGGGVLARHEELGEWRLQADAEFLFCENETGSKAAIGEHVVDGAALTAQAGTKCAAHHVLEIEAGRSASIQVRLSVDTAPVDFDAVFATRRAEADAFYAEVIPPTLDADRALVMRQALAGLLWGKQYYEYDVHRWLREHGVNPWDPNAPDVRNVPWFHMIAGDIISMPDKWEYPWFAAWDLAFHCGPLSLVDVDFAKEQVELLLHTRYLHPNGQIPAYEWNFSDVNPPVTAWAALWVYQREAEIRGEGDREFLARVFQRLLTNFTWWVNRKDPDGRNLFQGGFLGLDNIGIFDRSAPLPGGGTLRQADGTAWMALYCQWMLQIAIELGARRSQLRRHRAEVRHPLRLDRCSAESARRRHAVVGRAGRLLLRRHADARRDDDPAARALARRPAADVRGDGLRARGDRRPAGPGGARAEVRRALQRLGARARPHPGRESGGSAAARARRRSAATTDPQGDARRGGVPRPARHPRDLALPPRPPVHVRLGRSPLRGRLPARGVRQRHVRRQLELARAGLGADEPRDPPGAVPAAPLLRRGLQGRVPDRLGA